ncbi:MAG TPA: PH domain-containing protein [Pyrinomonadaceae bacterium]|jgi:membrane protein YdbS with pleckstrin-like domain|nr:PH domain-containing protein [Pyrinomonadaceae bacterium]
MNYCLNCGAALSGAARFCAACGKAADSEETRYASEETRIASEQTRLAAPRPAPVARPQPVVPLAQASARAPLQEEAERIVFTLNPTLLFIKFGYALAALGGIALVALLALIPRGWLEVPLYVSIPLGLSLLLIPAYQHIKRNMIRYTLTDSKIEIDRGFITRTTRNIPLRNIQDVTVTSTIFQRLLKFGDIVIDNASEVGGTTVLRNIPEPRRHADILLRELRRWR